MNHHMRLNGCSLMALLSFSLAAFGCARETPTQIAPAESVRLTAYSEPAGLPAAGEDEPAAVTDEHNSDSAALPLSREELSADTPQQVALADGDSASGKPKDISFDDLKFEIEAGAKFKREMLTEEIADLDGQDVKIRGYILPTFKQENIKQFILLQNTTCKFGTRDAYVYHNIRVQLDDGKATSFTTRPVTVEGKLSIKPLEGRSSTVSIYTLDAREVSH